MSTVESEMKTTALAGWYGSNRTLAATVGRKLAGLEHVVIPFAGGMCELAHIAARTLIVNDLHGAMINMAVVAAHPVHGPELYRRLRRIPFHPDVLKEAQKRCEHRDQKGRDSALIDHLFQSKKPPEPCYPDVDWAVDYFISCWAGRGGFAGKKSEFRGGMSIRYDAKGGDSNTRFRSAASGLPAWRRRVLWRCNFTCEDFRDCLAKVKDQDGHGVYADAPWPGPGDEYKHAFAAQDHRDLAGRLGSFKRTRVVVRFGVDPFIEELYPRTRWHWTEQTSRCQHNADVREALICNWKD